jgi:hypothetical protein
VQPILIKTATTVIVLAGLGLALFAGFTQSAAAILVLIVYLPLAWLTTVALTLLNPGERRSALSMLKRFRHQVDLAKQQLSSDPHLIDDDVLAAFNKLHADIKALLAQKKIRINELKRELVRFPYPASLEQGSRWRPPTLSELGYVIGISEKVAPDAPLLALYKFSGEESNHEGSAVDTFTIMSDSVPRVHAALFSAKVHSPKANYALMNKQPSAAPATPVPAATLAQRQPDDPIEAVAAAEATQSENSEGYALSLLGPITLSNTHELAENLSAMASLTDDATSSSAMPAAWVRRNLRDLLTERLAHSPAPLRMARRALLQEPQLLVSAIADARREGEYNPDALQSTVETLTEILLPSAPASRPVLASLTNDLMAFIQSLPVISTAQNIVNPGVVYVEARGAETDAVFLKQVAYWLLPAHQDASTIVTQVIMSAQLSEQAFRERLREFGELKPGQENQAVLDILLVALNMKKLALLTFHGADRNRPVNVRKHLPVPGKKPLRWLLFSANPALTDLTDCPPPVQHILWTLTGRALDTGKSDLIAPYYRRWRSIISNGTGGEA